MKKLLIIVTLFLLVGCTPVVEEVIPVQTLNPGIDIIGQGDIWEDAGCDVTIGTSTFKISRLNTVDNTEIAETEIQYSRVIGDTTYTCKRIVKVIDNTAPTLTLNPGIDTVLVNEEWIDTSVIATDDYSEVSVTVDSSVDITVAGTYTVIYTATDEEGNAASISRIVTIIE